MIATENCIIKNFKKDVIYKTNLIGFCSTISVTVHFQYLDTLPTVFHKILFPVKGFNQQKRRICIIFQKTI